MSKRLLMAVLLATVGPAMARDEEVAACLDRTTTVEQRDCIETLNRAASTELEALLEEKLQAATRADERASQMRSRQPPPLAPAIRRSQDAWQAYRDAECRGVVGRPFGSGTSVWLAACLVEKTRERIRELRVPLYQR